MNLKTSYLKNKIGIFLLYFVVTVFFNLKNLHIIRLIFINNIFLLSLSGISTITGKISFIISTVEIFLPHMRYLYITSQLLLKHCPVFDGSDKSGKFIKANFLQTGKLL